MDYMVLNLQVKIYNKKEQNKLALLLHNRVFRGVSFAGNTLRFYGMNATVRNDAALDFYARIGTYGTWFKSTINAMREQLKIVTNLSESSDPQHSSPSTVEQSQ